MVPQIDQLIMGERKGGIVWKHRKENSKKTRYPHGYFKVS
jgi:hypothetical protein